MTIYLLLMDASMNRPYIKDFDTEADFHIENEKWIDYCDFKSDEIKYEKIEEDKNDIYDKNRSKSIQKGK